MTLPDEQFTIVMKEDEHPAFMRMMTPAIAEALLRHED